MKYLLPTILLMFQAVAAQDGSGGVQIGRSHYLEGLRKDVNELQQKVYEEEQRFARLMRLKIHWDLLLPVRIEDLFADTSVSSKSHQDLAAELAVEIRREVALKTRFRRSGGIESDTPLPRIKDLVPDPAPGPGKKPETAVETPHPDAGEPGDAEKASAPSRDFGPLMMTRTSLGPTIERSQAITPFASSGDLTVFAPCPFLIKRVRALIGAGMSTEALAVLGARLQVLRESKKDPEPSLLFLEAKTLESLGELAKARQAYTQVTELDRGTNADGKDVFGIWAKSANFALEHLRWLEANRDYQPPDIKELK